MTQRCVTIFLTAFILLAGLAPGNGRAAMGRLGFRAGAAVSDVRTGSPSVSVDSRWGFTGGLATDLPLRGGLAVSLDFLYVRRGFLVRDTAAAQPTESAVGLGYLQAPVALNLAVVRSERYALKLLAGGYFAFRTRTDLRQDGLVDTELQIRLRQELDDYDLGLVGGLRCELEVGPRRFAVVDLRYDHGLRNIVWLRTAAAYNRSFQISVGMLFD